MGFDRRFYEINNCKGDQEALMLYAQDFFWRGTYPREIRFAAIRAVSKRNHNEMIIMADSSSDYALHVESAFGRELLYARSREDRYELICLTVAALYTPRFERFNDRLKEKVFAERRKYDGEYGKDDLAFLDRFIEDMNPYIESQKKWRQERSERIEREAQERKEKEEQERKEREKRREAEKAKRWEEHKARQSVRRKEREAEVDLFMQKPLSDRLTEIAYGRKTPSFYGMDFGAISEDELKTMPKSLMLKILLSFRSQKDEGWKELQKKAEKILTE